MIWRFRRNNRPPVIDLHAGMDIQLDWEDCDGISLKSAMSENALNEWMKLVPSGLENILHEDRCDVCHKPGLLVYCDGKCKTAYHVHCLDNPPDQLQDIWFCNDCVDKTQFDLPSSWYEPVPPNVPLPGYMRLECDETMDDDDTASDLTDDNPEPEVIDLCTPEDNLFIPVQPLAPFIKTGQALVTINIRGQSSHDHLTLYLITGETGHGSRKCLKGYRMRVVSTTQLRMGGTGEVVQHRNLHAHFYINHEESDPVEIRLQRHYYPDITFPVFQIGVEGSQITYRLSEEAITWYRMHGDHYAFTKAGQVMTKGFTHGKHKDGRRIVRALYDASNRLGCVN